MSVNDGRILDFRRPIQIGVLVIFLFFVVLGGWSALANISSAAIALGEVSVVSNRQTIQHLEGGIVDEIHVQEGSRVEPGQVLIRLSTTQAQAILDQLQARYLAVAAREVRLLAERDLRTEISFPDWLLSQQDDPEVLAVISGERNIFAAREESLNSHRSILRQRIAQYEEGIEGLTGEIEATESQLALFAEEISSMEDLIEQGFLSNQRFLELRRQEADTRGEQNRNVALVARARQSIAEQELQILELDSQRSNEVAAELRDVQTLSFELQEQINAARDVLARTDIVAPMAGTVVNLLVHTRGGVIASREPLLDIVPSDDQLVINARVLPRDIDVVREGLEARVRLLAFNQRDTVPLSGRVSMVSADRFLDERTGLTYYLTRVELTEDAFTNQEALEIYPGMQAEVMIVTGNRTALDYLMEPLTRSVRRAFRED
jgi:membrane fusion protein, type I secretion system